MIEKVGFKLGFIAWFTSGIITYLVAWAIVGIPFNYLFIVFPLILGLAGALIFEPLKYWLAIKLDEILPKG